MLLPPLVFLAITEMARGANALPHVAWAVPRQVAERGVIGALVFGWIRGVALLNHSPFLSMHGWVVALVLIPEVVAPLEIAVVLAVGLALWTAIDLAHRIVRNSTFRVDVAGAQVLVRSHVVARVDALVLLLCSGLILAGI